MCATVPPPHPPLSTSPKLFPHPSGKRGGGGGVKSVQKTRSFPDESVLLPPEAAHSQPLGFYAKCVGSPARALGCLLWLGRISLFGPTAPPAKTRRFPGEGAWQPLLAAGLPPLCQPICSLWGPSGVRGLIAPSADVQICCTIGPVHRGEGQPSGLAGEPACVRRWCGRLKAAEYRLPQGVAKRFCREACTLSVKNTMLHIGQ